MFKNGTTQFARTKNPLKIKHSKSISYEIVLCIPKPRVAGSSPVCRSSAQSIENHKVKQFAQNEMFNKKHSENTQKTLFCHLFTQKLHANCTQMF